MPWVDPRPNDFTDEGLRARFKSLEDYLKNPVFENGVRVGDGSKPTYNSSTGTTTPPPTLEVTSENIGVFDQDALQSDNYDGTNVATGDATEGWRIERDTGSAEFGNGVFRGTVEARRFIASRSDNLLANGDFGASQNTLSWTPISGTTLSITTGIIMSHALRATGAPMSTVGADSEKVPVTPGASYMVSYLVPASSPLFATLKFYTSGDALLETHNVPYWGGEGRLTGLIAPSNAAYAVIELRATLFVGTTADIEIVMLAQEPTFESGVFSNNGLRIEDEITFRPYTGVLSDNAAIIDWDFIPTSPGYGQIGLTMQTESFSLDEARIGLYSGDGSGEDSFIEMNAKAVKVNGHDLAGEWESYTPSIVNVGAGTDWSIGNGALLGKYKRIGKTVLFKMRCSWGSTSTFGSKFLGFTLPVEAVTATPGDMFLFQALCYDANGSRYFSVGEMNGTDYFLVATYNVASTYPTVALVTNTVPFNWVQGDYIMVRGFYEAA